MTSTLGRELVSTQSPHAEGNTPRRDPAHARARLGIEADEIDGGHYISLSRPRELAERLHAYVAAME